MGRKRTSGKTYHGLSKQDDKDLFKLIEQEDTNVRALVRKLLKEWIIKTKKK